MGQHTLLVKTGFLGEVAAYVGQPNSPQTFLTRRHFQRNGIKHIFNGTFHQPCERSQSLFFNRRRRSCALCVRCILMRPIAASRFARRAAQPLSCPAPFEKIFLFANYPNQNYKRAILSHRGAYRDRHGRWARDAVDERRRERRTRVPCGRRSRVVLMPRRWHQVGR
jgi:hypothetical protein